MRFLNEEGCFLDATVGQLPIKGAGILLGRLKYVRPKTGEDNSRLKEPTSELPDRRLIVNVLQALGRQQCVCGFDHRFISVLSGIRIFIALQINSRLIDQPVRFLKYE